MKVVARGVFLWFFLGLVSCQGPAVETIQIGPVLPPPPPQEEKLPLVITQLLDGVPDTVLAFRYAQNDQFVQARWRDRHVFFFEFDQQQQFRSYTLRVDGYDVKKIDKISQQDDQIFFRQEIIDQEIFLRYRKSRMKVLSADLNIIERLDENNHAESMTFRDIEADTIVGMVKFDRMPNGNLLKLEEISRAPEVTQPLFTINFEHDDRQTYFGRFGQLPEVVLLDIFEETRLSAFSMGNNATKLAVETQRRTRRSQEVNHYEYIYDEQGYPLALDFITDRFGVLDTVRYFITYR
ncbi:hypothetical protein [Persicobacter psychrovividus]|uniref:Uncharacterized protein n=1 Tax=Persicobacter psychrovividus TaxID=387638 RepID=A0ABM7VBN8_9BACT|nr:hypothetical protein PEPS_06250 [Persicobacter psychrovividus]